MQHIAALAALVPLVAAHGFVNSPPPREPGEAYKAACGDQPFNQQSADINGNVQGIFQVVGSDFDASKCNLWLCKGFLLEDNPDNVQSYSLGETIDFDVNIAAPHTGYANVSVVKTSSNSIIGEPLIEFSNYAANAGVQANNSAFSVTLPESLGGDCTTAGDCVLQWFWDAPDIDQTYEACVDFVVGSGSGSGSGGSGATASAPAASAPAADATSAPAADATSAVEAVTASSPIYSEIVPDVTTAPSAPEATATTGAGADEEECPADEEDDGEVDDGADDEEECPADDDEAVDDGDDEAADDEECPADEEEDSGDEYADETASEGSSGPTAAAVDAPKPTGSYGNSGYGSSGSGSGSNGSASTVTSYVTVSAETKYVTVTADAPACTP